MKPIEEIYCINPGTLDRINKFKKFVGEEKFNLLLQGVDTLDIPLEEDKYKELLGICLDTPYFKPVSSIQDLADIPFSDCESIISFFCKPFAGRYLKQVKYTLDGISSSLRKLDPETIRTLMESGTSRKTKGTITDVSSSQTETLKKENDIIN